MISGHSSFSSIHVGFYERNWSCSTNLYTPDALVTMVVKQEAVKQSRSMSVGARSRSWPHCQLQGGILTFDLLKYSEICFYSIWYQAITNWFSLPHTVKAWGTLVPPQTPANSQITLLPEYLDKVGIIHREVSVQILWSNPMQINY
jgi:hypothetical protein